jgi:hypothetical protein
MMFRTRRFRVRVAAEGGVCGMLRKDEGGNQDERAGRTQFIAFTARRLRPAIRQACPATRREGGRTTSRYYTTLIVTICLVLSYR